MPDPSRRRFLATTAALGAGALLPVRRGLAAPAVGRGERTGRVPLVHVTDLYHPPQDPDDQLDLATIAALEELDLRAVVLDVTERFLVPAPEGFDVARDPGFVPVAQLGYLLGRVIPTAAGPTQPLRAPDDDARDRPQREQAGIDLLLDALESSAEPVVISAVGSARVVTAAFNRAPELMRAKTRAVLLNAGSTSPERREWNVDLDPAAYVGLWRSGLPIRWYPCATERGAFAADHERGTYWKASHHDLFEGLPDALRAWFAYGFAGSARGDVIGALRDLGAGAVWEHVLAGTRNVWATASLAMAAGRVLAQTSDGWRFVRESEADGLDRWPWRLDPITAEVNADAEVRWHLADGAAHRLFGRRPGAGFGTAMTGALNVLLRTTPV